MALVNRQIKGLHGGVSKQPPELAYEIQVEEIHNCSVSPVNGIESIPKEKYYKKIVSSLRSFDTVFYINKNNGEDWLVQIRPDKKDIVFNSLTGLPTTAFSPMEYLTGYGNDFKLLPLGDYLFLANKNIIPKMKETVTENYRSQPIVWKVLKTSPVVSYIDTNNNYHYKNITYTISIGINLEAFGDSGEGVVSYTNNSVETEAILDGMYSALGVSRSFSANGKTYTVSVNRTKNTESKTLHINYVTVSDGSTTITMYPDNEYLNVGYSDDMGGSSSILIKDTIDDYSKLPADVGFEKVVKVTGLDENDNSNFYLKCNRNGWEECLGSEVTYELDQDTMPLVFYRDSDGVWKRKTDYWDNRRVGDNDTTPEPSFIGKGIVDLFFFENRLGFITDSNVILSEQGIYSNFWNTTQRQLPDTDPIDLAIADKDYLSLLYAITTPAGVLLVDKNKQYLLNKSNYDYLTPLSANISIIGRYSIFEDVRPIFIENKIFALQKVDNYYNLLLGIITNGELQFNIISKQVKGYISDDTSPIKLLSFNNNILILFKDKIYVWTYLFDGENTLVSAYHKWLFDEYVLMDIHNKNNEQLLLITLDNDILSIDFKNPTEYKNSYIKLKTFLLKNKENVGNLRDIIKLKSLIIDGENYLVTLTYKNRQHTIKCSKRKVFVLNDIHNTIIEITNNEEGKMTLRTINYEVDINNISRSI